MPKRGFVSVIISTFNNKGTIKACLESITGQTYQRIEVIVVDEWSSDGTAEIARSMNARVFSHGTERANNRNFGISKAKGAYYCIVDSDMTLRPNVVGECVDLCEKGYDAIIIPEKSIGQGFWANVRAFERQFTTGEKSVGDNAVEAARFFPKALIEKVGGYDPTIVGVEDWDLHQRILAQGYKIGRAKSYIIHREGRLSLKRLLKKKLYYGSAFLEYRRRYPKAFRKSIMRLSLLTNWYYFLLKPHYGMGVIFLKLLEGIALFCGMVLASRGMNPKHY